MSKVVTMGELLLRLTATNYQRFVQTNSFDVYYGGAEANVSVSCANFGLDTYYVTKLPNNQIGQAAINYLNRYSVHTDYIAKGGDRVGLYYFETGASMRPSRVIYDRKYSSMAEADLNDFNFDTIFKDADWFHITGITPAISEEAALITEKALKKAKEHNVKVSFDINYRSKLWSIEKASKVLSNLMKYVDVCIGIDPILGVKLKNNDITQLTDNDFYDVCTRLQEKYGFRYIITSLRKTYSASDNEFGGLIFNGKDIYRSKKYDIRIIDRVGGGDAFASGLIYGFLNKYNYKETLEFAVAASALKHTIQGDANLVTTSEIESLYKDNKTAKVQR